MRRRGMLSLAALALGLLAASPAAKAEYFEYTTTVTITSFSPGGTIVTTAGQNNTSTATAASGNQVQFIAQGSNPALPHLNGTGGGSNIVPIQINPNVFPGQTASENFDLNFTVTLTLTDYPDPNLAVVPTGSGTFTFNGRLQGTVGNFQSALNTLSFGTLPQTQVIGGTSYLVTFTGFTPPGPDNNGTIGLNVRAVPEPGSLALLGMGGVGALGMFLRRRVRASA